MNGPKRPGLQPRSALTPPDPLRRSTRPARISPSGRVSFLSPGVVGTGKQIPSPDPAFEFGPSRRVMMSSDSVVCRGLTDPVSGLSLLTRASDDSMSARRATQLFHVGAATCTCTRGGRPEMARTGRASPCAFSRALRYRALETLLQRDTV